MKTTSREASTMKKLLGLTAALCVIAASAAFACPKDGDQASSSKCMGAKSATAASHKSGGGNCEGMAASGGCTMDAAECAKMEHTTFSVKGLTSAEAAAKVKTALAGMNNVHDVSCDTKNCTATVCWKGTKASAAVAEKLGAAGYKTAVLKADATCPYASGATAGKACPHGAVKTSVKTKTT
jgi:hypothetical protein